MGESENRNGPQFRAGPLITSASLVGAGTLIVLAGLAVGGGHLVSATRRWISEMEVPPSEVAKQKWAQTRAAVSAVHLPAIGLAERTAGLPDQRFLISGPPACG